MREIDPSLVGESRWGQGFILFRPFVYLAHLVSSLWNKVRVAELQSSNMLLKGAMQLPISKLDSLKDQLVHQGVSPDELETILKVDAQLNNQIKQLRGPSPKKTISWGGRDDQFVQIETCEYELSRSEKTEKQFIVRRISDDAARLKKRHRSGKRVEDYQPRRSIRSQRTPLLARVAVGQSRCYSTMSGC